MNENRPVFIVFEGLDGTGKSTVARGVAEALRAEFLTTPSPELREYREAIVASFGDCQEAAQLFYLATVFDASRRVKSLLAAGRSVVLDRYFLSTQAYAAFRGSVLGLDHVGDLLVPATLTVILHAPLDVRVARVTRRGESAADRETLTLAADRRLHAEHAARLHLSVAGRVLRLDSGGRTPQSLVQQVVERLVHESGVIPEQPPEATRKP